MLVGYIHKGPPTTTSTCATTTPWRASRRRRCSPLCPSGKCREARLEDLGTTCGFGHSWPGVDCGGAIVLYIHGDVKGEAAPTILVEEGERMARAHA